MLVLWIILYLLSCIVAYFVTMYIMYKSNHYMEQDNYMCAVFIAIFWPLVALVAGFVVGTMALGEWTVERIKKIEESWSTPPPPPASHDEMPD
jgi:cytochrome bd-type quinol oxidase subunit 1